MDLKRFNVTASDIGRVALVAAANVALIYGIRWVVKNLDPARREREKTEKQAVLHLNRLGLKHLKLSEHELAIAADLVDTTALRFSWSSIGGLDSVIEQLKDNIILPLSRRDLFVGSSLLAPPRGVLLYGPPGCGKTLLAKALAKEAHCHFINLQLASLADKWYGESQKLAAAVFSLALKLQPVVVFIDEIDAFLRSRQTSDHETTAMMKAQFMSLWDGLESDPSALIVVVGATNRPQDVDVAIMRRMPLRFHVNLPTAKERLEILKVILAQERLTDDVDLHHVAEHTERYTGSDLKELCRNAALNCVRDSLRNEDSAQGTPVDGDSPEGSKIRPIRMADLDGGLKGINQSSVASTLLGLTLDGSSIS